MIKAVLFDFGQTLVDSADGFRAAEKAAKAWLFADLFPSGGDWSRFLEVYRGIRAASHRRSRFSRTAIWEQVYGHFERPFDAVRLEKEERRYWATVKRHTRPFPETLPVLAALAESYPLALVTNTQGQKRGGGHRIALFPEVERFFACVLVAGEAGVAAKPAAQPFLRAAGELGVDPGQAAYVGDDFRIDIEGARNAGLHPVWLQHRSVTRNWPEVRTRVPVLDSLARLPELLPSLDRSAEP